MYIQTKNSNLYWYSEKESLLLYNPNVNKGDYKNRKDAFLKSNGLMDDYYPDFITNYDPNYLKVNLANLRMLIIEVTDLCNLSCEYCGYGKLYNNYDKRIGKKQSFENVKLMIDYLSNLWKSSLNVSYNNEIGISFYGGEPLIAIDLIKEIISYIESLNFTSLTFSYYMTTNSYLLDKYMDYLVDKNFHLLLSLDGDKENNSYRVTRDNASSFEKVYANIIGLYKKYPAFFETNVGFNSVLHNRNSVLQVSSFIKNNFNKIPTVAELNSNGIAEDKRNEFFSMYKNRFQDAESLGQCENLGQDMLLMDSSVMSFSFFIDAFTSNTYMGYADLFVDKKKQRYIPTGTCQPLKRKIFLTVNNKILSCERIGQLYSLGKIENGEVRIDFNAICDFYSNMYKSIVEQCKQCVLWNNCTLCVYFILDDKGRRICNRFLSKKKAGEYFSEYLSMAENQTFLFKKIIDRMDRY